VAFHELLLDPNHTDSINDVITGEVFDLLPVNERMVDRTGGKLNGESRVRTAKDCSR